MKKYLAPILFATLVGFSQADTKFPKGTLEVKDLEKAKAQATAAKKSIAFILTDKKTTCPLCQGAAAVFIDAVKSKSVIIYVESDQASQASLPSIVLAAMNGGGNHIPKVVVTDAAVESATATITYDTYKADERKSLKEFKKAL